MTTFHVAVLGIDGSGKSTLVDALVPLLAGELGVRAGAAGDGYSVVTPEEQLVGGGFHPDGLPVSARLARRFRRLAKRNTGRRRVYPVFKLAQLLLQDDAARRLSARHALDVFITDGNALMCAAGRTGNYSCRASQRAPADEVAGRDDQRALYARVLDGAALDERSRRALSALRWLRPLSTAARLAGLAGAVAPDLVLFLDVSPEVALRRIAARGCPADAHENLADLRQARSAYLATIAGFARYRGEDAVHRIAVDALRPAQVLGEALRIISAHASLPAASRPATAERPLGTTDTGAGLTRRILGSGYVAHLIRHSIDGAWREPFFLAARTGRRLLREGYSAGVMRCIYDQDPVRDGLAERILMGYPLHRAVRDRLRILEQLIEPEIQARLDAGREVRVVTAPSGLADDLFWSLERIADRSPDALNRVKVVAADLDPSGRIHEELRDWADHLGIGLAFIRGDLTSDGVRAEIAAHGPYDVALFVGLSAWLPVPALLSHLRWMRRHSRDGAVLLTDCFSAASYAAGGKFLGYRATYYRPQAYRAVLDRCGFAGSGALCESGANGINHVLVASAGFRSSRRSRRQLRKQRRRNGGGGGSLSPTPWSPRPRTCSPRSAGRPRSSSPPGSALTPRLPAGGRWVG